MTGSIHGSETGGRFEPYGASGHPQQGADSRQAILDDEHLRLLRIGYFISAAQTAILIPIGLLYAGMGFLVSYLPTGSGPPPSSAMPWVLGIFGGGFAAIGFVVALLKLLTAIRLKERRSRLLCLITAGISCLEIPYGTALGVCTFVVLGRPSVRQKFDERN